MKAKKDEIWAIYRRNLSQNSRWDINLPLKINFGRWIAILLLKSHLGRRINTDVIWAVRSCCMKEGEYCRFFGDLSSIYQRFIATRSDFFTKSLIYRQYFGHFCGNIFHSIFLHEISCWPFPIHYRRYILKFSSLLIP